MAFNAAGTILRMVLPAAAGDSYNTATGATVSTATPDPITGTGTEDERTIAQIRDFNPPPTMFDEIDTTTIEMTEKRFQRACLRDGGEMTLNTLFDPGVDINVLKGIQIWFMIKFPFLATNGTDYVEWRFGGRIISATPAIPLNDAAMNPIVVKLATDITIFNPLT